MFGLSTKEVLSKAIINACYNCKDTYKKAIMDNIENLNNIVDEKRAKEMFAEIRRQYLDDVANNVINTFKVSSPNVFARIKLSLMSPSICGYEDINIDTGIMAGSVFAICFYAMKNKVAPANVCVRLNHIQNDIMDEILQEVDNELFALD